MREFLKIFLADIVDKVTASTFSSHYKSNLALLGPESELVFKPLRKTWQLLYQEFQLSRFLTLSCHLRSVAQILNLRTLGEKKTLKIYDEV